MTQHLAITITRNPWPDSMPRHWHIPATGMSEYVYESLAKSYAALGNITRFEGYDCPECGEQVDRRLFYGER